MGVDEGVREAEAVGNLPKAVSGLAVLPPKDLLVIGADEGISAHLDALQAEDAPGVAWCAVEALGYDLR